MTRVKCANGHFFDRDRFDSCPACGCTTCENVTGKGIGKFNRSQTPASQRSQIDDVGKTWAYLEDQSVSKTSRTASGEVGGIKWNFSSARGEKAVSQEPETETAPHQEASVQDEPSAGDSVTPSQSGAQNVSLADQIIQTGSGAVSALPSKSEGAPPFPAGWLVCTKGVYRGYSFVIKTGRNRIGRGPNCNINLEGDPSISVEPHAMIIYDPKSKVFYLQNGAGEDLVYRNGNLLFTHEELQPRDTIQLGKAEFLFVPLCGGEFNWDEPGE